MAELVAPVALVVDSEVILEGPGHGDESKIPKVRQFAGVAAVENKAGEYASDGFVFIGKVEMDTVLDLPYFTPGRLVVQYGQGDPTGWRFPFG